MILDAVTRRLAHIAQPAERVLGKNEVIGSNPIVGSRSRDREAVSLRVGASVFRVNSTGQRRVTVQKARLTIETAVVS